MAYKTASYSSLAKLPSGGTGQDFTTNSPSDTVSTQINQKINSGLVSQSPGQASPSNESPGQQYDLKKNYETADRQGNVQLGDPKVYDSVGDAGSGFVNLSHLLALNRGSGAKSALDLANRTKQSGQSALGGISGLEGQFNKQVGDQLAPARGAFFSPNMENPQGAIDAAKGASYKGPSDLSSMGGYADLSKKVSDAENMAKNTQSGMGMATEVNKETGLSPTQSAASAFYMGVNNPNVKRAGSQFTNLTKALSDANSHAFQTANYAKGEIGAYAGKAGDWQSQLDQYNDPRNLYKPPEQQWGDDYDKLIDASNNNTGSPEQQKEWQDFGQWLRDNTYTSTTPNVVIGSNSRATKEAYVKWKQWKQAHGIK